MRIECIGGGPASLYFSILMKQAVPAAEITVYERNLADDFMGVSSRNGALESKAETVVSVGTYKVTQADSTDVQANVDGDRAHVTGVYHTRGTDEKGKAFQRKIRYIDTFIKRDGRWQIWSSQGTAVTE